MLMTELTDLSVEDLEAKLLELSEARFRLRFRRATETIDDTSQFRTMRRDVARIKTLLRAKRVQD